MADTLKPCPFCGGAAKPIPPTPRAYAFVECVGCRVATSGFATTKGAEDAWNDRAPDPERAALAERVRDLELTLGYACRLDAEEGPTP